MGRRVVVQHSSLGGFNAVEFQLKVSALHVQWVRHFVASLSSRFSFMVFWFSSVLNAPPHVVFFSPPALSFSRLPPFYVSLLQACKGSFSVSSPVVPFVLSQPSLLTFFLSLRMSPPHCVVKFRPLFGPLYWSVTWCQLFLFVLECPVIDLSWKFAHGVLYTAERLFFFWPVFVLVHWNFHSICSLIVRWPLLFFPGFSLGFFWRPLSLLLSLFVTSFLVFLRTSCMSSLGFSFTYLTLVSSVFGGPGTTFIFMASAY